MKNYLKQQAKQHLANHYGFAPALKDIILLEADYNVNKATGYIPYLLFKVNGNDHIEYRVLGHKLIIEEV